MSIIIGMAGECQQIKDQNQWTTVRTEDIVKAHFPCIFAWVIETPWYTGECRATSCLSCSSCHSQQAVPALPQQLHSQRRLPGTRHARFLHPSSQTRSERARKLPTVPIFLTEKVHVGIERNRATPTKWRTGSSCRCMGGSRHMVDCCTFEFLDGSVISTLSSLKCVAARSLLCYFVCCSFSSRMSRGGCYGMTNADWLISLRAAQLLPGNPGFSKERGRNPCLGARSLSCSWRSKRLGGVGIGFLPAFFCESRDSWRKCMREARFPSHLPGVWAPSDPSALRASGSDSPILPWNDWGNLYIFGVNIIINFFQLICLNNLCCCLFLSTFCWFFLLLSPQITVNWV